MSLGRGSFASSVFFSNRDSRVSKSETVKENRKIEEKTLHKARSSAVFNIALERKGEKRFFQVESLIATLIVYLRLKRLLRKRSEIGKCRFGTDEHSVRFECCSSKLF